MLTETTIRRLNTLGKVSLQGKRVNGLFRLMENPILWKQAYANIYSNKGAITKGVDADTLDGFSEARVLNIIRLLKQKEYRFKPVRRTYIPKSNGKMRPLGIPSGNDKLVQEVARQLLEKLYEPVFSEKSHGFRPERSCHTALQQVRRCWTGTKWIIEMDIKGYFDNIDHDVLIALLEKKIDDKRFISLIRRMLKAGYVENWKFERTHSGVPQGGIISPILANIYLHELDLHVKALQEEFNLGKKRKGNPEYKRISHQIRLMYKEYDLLEVEGADSDILKQLRQKAKQLSAVRAKLPAGDPRDPNYRRLNYCRYADDFILGVIGTREDADEIMNKVIGFLHNRLHLEMAEDKTGIKYAQDGTRFLGYDIKSCNGRKVIKVRRGSKHVRAKSITENIQLLLPRDRIVKFCREHGYGDYGHYDMASRNNLLRLSNAEIVSIYNAEMRGFANYYALAISPSRTMHKLAGMWQGSLLKTLAHKNKTTVTKMARKLKQSNGRYVLMVYTGKTTRSIPVYNLKAEFTPTLVGYARIDALPNTWQFTVSRTEVIQRLEAKICEYCGRESGDMEVHHVRKLKDLNPGRAFWQQMMAARKRKTLILCSTCHRLLHAGKLPDRETQTKKNMESRIH